MVADRVQALLARDPYLTPYADAIERRLNAVEAMARRLTGGRMPLADFASGHEYFGLHFREGKWVFREWAPNAERMHLIGPFSGWEAAEAFALSPIGENDVWEIQLPADRLSHGDLYRLHMQWPGGSGDRIPAWTRRVVQDPETLIFNAQVWHPPNPYVWTHRDFRAASAPPLIYEAHVGMAQEAESIGTFSEFTERVLPRIVAAGYNTLQLMAVQEHPYYGSFGYQVSSFFAPSGRFGTPEDLKALVDTAHGYGLRVLMDLIHSHAVSNEVEGLSRFDGTLHQFFHAGDRGRHIAWDSRCFDYGKPAVVHFLLSNCRYWLDEFRFDGFRFDGITSMLYRHHGLETAFTSYDAYFDASVDEDALVYLTLANRLTHDLRDDAVTVAEDVSGLPGLALPESEGGFGFDYRFAMGVPDYWIRLTKDCPDENWPMGHLWHELTNRRAEEKTISYAESHDQALVGDQTLVFRLMGADMYDHMHKDDPHLRVDRGMALHKIIRLLTLATAGHGYLNFMGNEFGHPEWIDFPRAGNDWSYRYARRQWHLADHPDLKYRQLAAFDRAMIALAVRTRLLNDPFPRLLHEQNDDKVLVFARAGLVIAVNIHPTASYSDYRFHAPPGRYRLVLTSDDPDYGGHGRLAPGQIHHTRSTGDARLSLYLPSRTCQVLEELDAQAGKR